MFTGLVEEIGSVKNIQSIGGGKKITLSSESAAANASIGESINVNGVCQTVVDLGKNYFAVEAVEETLKKTNLAHLKIKHHCATTKSHPAVDNSLPLLERHYLLYDADF